MKSGKKVGVIISLILLVGVLSASLVMAEAVQCITDSDCDDGDSCTLDTCSDGFCFNDFSDNVVPDTDVIFATKDNGDDQENCVNGKMYVNFDIDDVVINFYSQDTCSNLKTVEYLRTGWNGYWDLGVGFIGDNVGTEDYWHSNPDDYWPDKEYKICGRANDILLNQENDGLSINDVPDDDCCVLCIDKEDPDDIENLAHSNPSACVSEYVNVNPQFDWNATNDNGCAGIDYYNVKINDNGSLITTIYTSSIESYEISSPTNGHFYSIKVQAVDKAGNTGSWSSWSVKVYYDDEDPIATITGPSEDEWIDPGFDLSELDTDNLGLYECSYKIVNDGNRTLGWTLTTCNADIYIDVDTYCPVDGEDKCEIYKEVVDKACNDNGGMEIGSFDIDTTEPVVNKTVGTPKILGWKGFEWLNEFFDVDWFVTDTTEFTLTCDDGIGSGVQSITYSINQGTEIVVNDGDAEDEDLDDDEVEVMFKLSPDGIYEIEYYCTDNVDKESIHKNETDKVDTIAPETIKEYIGPKYPIQEHPKYINNETLINLTASDTEVGVDITEYRYALVDDRYCGDSVINGASTCVGVGCEPPVSYDCDNAPIEAGWKTYLDPFTIPEESCHVIEYRSTDLLGNQEATPWQCVFVDVTAPEFTIINDFYEDKNISCQQSIVIEITDDKSGVKEARVEWYDSSDTLIDSKEMSKYEFTDPDSWHVTFDELYKWVEGAYYVKIIAYDNVNNEKTMIVNVNLPQGIVCASIQEPCRIPDPSIGGSCVAKMHVGIRGGNAIKMDMEDLFGVAPQNLSARITNTSSDTNAVAIGNVNYLDEPQWNGGILPVSDEYYTDAYFWVHLNIPANLDAEYPFGDFADYYLKTISI